jgi:hypothetical protein
MNGHAGQVVDFAQAALSPSAPWAPADVARSRPAAVEAQPEDWTGLERMEQVVARQRRAMVRDLVAAVLFAGLCVTVVIALL